MRNLNTRALTRKGQWVRLALAGPTGSGKTRTSILFALELASAPEKVCFVDTEVAGPEDEEAGTIGAADLFADDFPGVRHFQWEPPFAPEELADALKVWEPQFEVIVIDSLSHFWVGEGGTMAIKDKAEREQFRGNGAAAWSVATPAQDALVDSIQRARCHLIGCMRAKDKLDLSGDRPRSLGLQSIQRPGLDHEFTIALMMDRAHTITVTKTRFPALEGRTFGPSRDDAVHLGLIREIREWLDGAGELAHAAPAELVQWIRSAIQGIPDQRTRGHVKDEFRREFGATDRLTADTIGPAVAWVEAKTGTRPAGVVAEALPYQAPKAAKAAAKRAKRSPAAPVAPVAAPEADPAPSVPETGGGAPGGSEGVPVEARARGVLRNVFLRLTPEWAAKVEAVLKDADLWPIEGIADGDVDRAMELAAPIAEAAADAGGTLQ